MTRIKRDTIGYLLIALVSVVFLLWAIPTYTPPYPGYGASPALVPNVVVGVMLFMALLALVRNALAVWGGKPLSKSESEYPAADETGGFTQVGQVRLLHLSALMLPCALLVPAFDWVGYNVAAFVFLLVFQYILGRRQVLPAVILAAAMTVVIYIAMRYVFGVPIPGV